MAYQLRYYKELRLDNGDARLEIHRNVPTGINLVAIPIGDVMTGLKLDIQGQTEDIDAPVLKTTLTLSLVDAPERNSATEKWGDWEEFYTPDSEEWKVVLLVRKEGDASYIPFWSGYITPDSYVEQLQYHGVVSVMARDNIGHLQDFLFDAVGNADGMITPYELVTEAWAKISCPLTLDWRGEEDENEWPQTQGINATYTYMNVSAFEGKTWYDALSEMLYAYGLVMRFVGRNKVAVCPLRRMPAQGRASADDVATLTPLFEAYATRELVPAVKEIEDVTAYDLPGEAAQPMVREDDFTGETVSAIVNAEDVFGEIDQMTIALWPVSNSSELGWGNIPTDTLFFNPHAYSNQLNDADAVDSQTFLAVNTEPRAVWYGRSINCQPLTVRLERGVMMQRYGEALVEVYGYELEGIRASVKMTINGTEYFYDGETWSTAYVELTLPFEDGVVTQEIQFPDISGLGILQFFIHGVEVSWITGYPQGGKGVFLGIKSLSIGAPSYQSLRERNTVLTVYDEANNVRMSRNPSLGPAYDRTAIPEMIRNGIFVKVAGVYSPTPEWKWSGDAESVQLGVLVHKQLLCYHSKPNNLISGTILNADLTDIRTIWTWKDREHMMISGSLDYCTGRIEGAVLREFARYEDMW